jgi:N-acetylglucosaminyldiphosphoundecaprenol N-acetyl-beta-D-mannosaminyltransferase
MSVIYILGAKIDDLSLKEAIDKIAAFLLTSAKGYITTPNPEICLWSYKSKTFRRILQNAWLSIPDGFGLKIGAKILGTKLNETNKLKNITTGVDLSVEVIKLAEQNNYSVLILGGTQEAGERTLSLYSYKYPKLKLKYLNGGNFSGQGISDQANLIDQINIIKPDIIFVCLGAPKQEYFMAENLVRLNSKLMLGVGGSIDFLAMQIKRAPNSWRRLGMEWLWRLIQEPWRWKRIAKAVIIFPLVCIYWRICSEFCYRNNVAGFIINSKGQIFLGKHAKTGEWKFPQGGSKNAKTDSEYKTAILREMKQELGTDKFEIITYLKNCHKYKFPKNILTWNYDKFVGQRQSLFLLKFIGQDSDIQIDKHEHSDWQWLDKNKILDIAPIKRHAIIKIGLEKFKDYL